MTGPDVLRAAAAAVTPDTWCQHTTYQDEYDEPMVVRWGASRACALGQLAIAANDDLWAFAEAVDLLTAYVDADLNDWNDRPGMTAADVRAALLAAAAAPVRTAVTA